VQEDEVCAHMIRGGNSYWVLPDQLWMKVGEYVAEFLRLTLGSDLS